MAKMGQQTLPIANNPSLNIIESEEDWVDFIKFFNVYIIILIKKFLK
jgi:hypothetical protein